MCFQCCQSMRITGQHKKLSLGGWWRRLGVANTRGRARLCLFLNLKIKTLFIPPKNTTIKIERPTKERPRWISDFGDGWCRGGEPWPSGWWGRRREELQSALIKIFYWQSPTSTYLSPSSAFQASQWAYSGDSKQTHLSNWYHIIFSTFILNIKIIFSSSEPLGFRTWT